MAKSTITSKFQTTVPKEIREKLRITVSDQLRWTVRDGEIVVQVERPDFLTRRGCLDGGPDPVEAVREMRETRGRS